MRFTVVLLVLLELVHASRRPSEGQKRYMYEFYCKTSNSSIKAMSEKPSKNTNPLISESHKGATNMTQVPASVQGRHEAFVPHPLDEEPVDPKGWTVTTPQTFLDEHKRESERNARKRIIQESLSLQNHYRLLDKENDAFEQFINSRKAVLMELLRGSNQDTQTGMIQGPPPHDWHGQPYSQHSIYEYTSPGAQPIYPLQDFPTDFIRETDRNSRVRLEDSLDPCPGIETDSSSSAVSVSADSGSLNNSATEQFPAQNISISNVPHNESIPKSLRQRTPPKPLFRGFLGTVEGMQEWYARAISATGRTIGLEFGSVHHSVYRYRRKVMAQSVGAAHLRDKNHLNLEIEGIDARVVELDNRGSSGIKVTVTDRSSFGVGVLRLVDEQYIPISSVAEQGTKLLNVQAGDLIIITEKSLIEEPFILIGNKLSREQIVKAYMKRRSTGCFVLVTSMMVSLP